MGRIPQRIEPLNLNQNSPQPQGTLIPAMGRCTTTLPGQFQIEAGSLEVLGTQFQPHSGAESAWKVSICGEKKRAWGKIDSSYFFPYYLLNGPHSRGPLW